MSIKLENPILRNFVTSLYTILFLPIFCYIVMAHFVFSTVWFPSFAFMDVVILVSCCLSQFFPFWVCWTSFLPTVLFRQIQLLPQRCVLTCACPSWISLRNLYHKHYIKMWMSPLCVLLGGASYHISVQMFCCTNHKSMVALQYGLAYDGSYASFFTEL